MMQILTETDTSATVIHPLRAFQIRGLYLAEDHIEEAVDIEQVEFYGVYAYENNQTDGPAWHLKDVSSMEKAIEHTREFVRRIS